MTVGSFSFRGTPRPFKFKLRTQGGAHPEEETGLKSSLLVSHKSIVAGKSSLRQLKDRLRASESAPESIRARRGCVINIFGVCCVLMVAS